MYEAHPIATRYREMNEDEFKDLCDSIKDIGLIHPITMTEGKILDGVNRQRACHEVGVEPRYVEYTGDNPEAFVRGQNEARRHLTAAERALKAVKQATAKRGGQGENQHTKQSAKVSNETLAKDDVTLSEAAKAAGVSEASAKRISAAVSTLGEEKVEELVEQGESTASIEKQAKEAKKKREREEAKEVHREKAQAYADTVMSEVFVADIRNRQAWMDGIKQDSIDTIITDPPYPKDYIGCLDHLSRFAFHALKPGGDLFVLYGQSYLPDAVKRLGTWMDYYWTMGYLTLENRTELRQRDCFSNWKPILHFTKGPRSKQAKFITSDIINSPYQAKTNHHWEQDVEGFKTLIDRVTHEHSIVCDPFCGSGTTLVAADLMGRKYYGFDIDNDAINMTIKRLIEEGATDE